MFYVFARNLPRLRPLTRGKSYLVVSPDPMYRPGSLVPCWALQLGDSEGSVEEEFAPWNPTFAVAYNDGPTGSGKQLDKGILKMMHKSGDKPEKYGRKARPDPWFRFLDRGKNGAQDQMLREIFLGLLDDFPAYQLRTQQGLERSAEDFNALLRVVPKHLAADSMLTQYDKTLLARILTDDRYWKTHESIDWVELSKDVFNNKLAPNLLKNYWVHNAWPKYETVRNLEDPDFSSNSGVICPELPEERRPTMEDLERLKTSQEYKYILYAMNTKCLNFRDLLQRW